MNKVFECFVSIFSYPSIQTALGAQKNRLIETVLLSTHNIIMFLLRNKIINFNYTLLTRGLVIPKYTPAAISLIDQGLHRLEKYLNLN